MSITRRQFLKRAGLATAGTVLAPHMFSNPFVRHALAETIGDRYLVVIFLNGGNDGLNTIVPIDDLGGLRTAYNIHRTTSASGGINIATDDLAVPVTSCVDPNTGETLGFHPALASFRDMYDDGDVAVIQGCGYPDYSLSHDESRNIWWTANPAGIASLGATGWCGRHLSAEYGPLDIPGVSISSNVAPDFRQVGTSVLAIDDIDEFLFPVDDYAAQIGAAEEAAELAAYRAAYDDVFLAAGFSDEPMTNLIGNTGQATVLSTDSYPPLESLYDTDRPGFKQAYSDLKSSMARDLRDVARIIYGVSNGEPGVTARFFRVSNSGYDTHADQGGKETTGRHSRLHAEVADSVKLFYDDMADMGIANKVTTVIYSEFSRRIPQNDNGTDHGSQGPMFVIGPSVTGGVYGNHPNIDPLALGDDENTPYSQDAIDPFRSTDFRDVFGTLLKHWVNMSEVSILADVLPLDIGPAAEYWTVHDFDMGFL